jgi:hypothetical protein
MVSEYTLNDEVSTLRIWFDTKPFSEELQEDIKNINLDLISEEAKEIYFKERVKNEKV